MRRAIAPAQTAANDLKPVEGADLNGYYWVVSGWLAGADQCSACSGGTYQDEEGTTVCKACVAGSYCPEGAAAPLPCPATTFSSATDNDVNCLQGLDDGLTALRKKAFYLVQ